MNRPEPLNEYILYEIDNLPVHSIKTVVVGDLGYTLILYTDYTHISSKIEVSDICKRWGGEGLYVVDSLTHLGGSTILFTYAGADNEGTRILEHLASIGADIKSVKKVPGGNTPFKLLVVEKDSNKIMLDINYRGVQKIFSIRTFKYENLINGISSLHVEGSLINDQTIDEINYMLKYFTNRGVSTSITQNINSTDIYGVNFRRIIKNVNVIFLYECRDMEVNEALKTAEELKKLSESLITVVFINPYKIFIHHFNNLFSINDLSMNSCKYSYKDFFSPLSGNAIDFAYLFTGAFIFFYQKRVPIELSGLFSMLYAKASKRRTEKTGVETIKRMLHKYKIIDSGNNIIMIQ